MPFRVVGGKLEFLPTSIVCQLREGDRTVLCMIVREVLRDLGDYHRLNLSEQGLFSVLLPDIERMADAKIRAGRLDQHGHVRIEAVDLLRYGLGTPRVQAAE